MHQRARLTTVTHTSRRESYSSSDNYYTSAVQQYHIIWSSTVSRGGLSRRLYYRVTYPQACTDRTRVWQSRRSASVWFMVSHYPVQYCIARLVGSVGCYTINNTFILTPVFGLAWYFFIARWVQHSPYCTRVNFHRRYSLTNLVKCRLLARERFLRTINRAINSSRA